MHWPCCFSTATSVGAGDSKLIMALATTTPPGTDLTRGRRKIAIALVVVAIVIGGIAFGMSRKWPFAEGQLLRDLREASDSQVQVRGFRQTYFPSPGCVVEGLVFHHQPGEAKPLITIEKLTIKGSYLGLLAMRVNRITAEEMVVSIPPFDTHARFHTARSKITIGEIVANGAVVEFGTDNPNKKPLRFEIHDADLQNVGWAGAMSYRVKVGNPSPPGEVSAEGKFGVWNLVDAGETPISGTYKFERADLSVYGGIAGTLESEGKFAGKLAHIDIEGTTDTPDFKVQSSSHTVRLTSRFSAYVDATKGDTYLKQVDADFLQTHVVAAGSIATSADGKGKTAVIDVRAKDARIEDLLLLFVEAKQAPMTGTVELNATVELPPGDDGFLSKVKVRGRFGLAGGMFSNVSTREGVDKLSAGAQGEKKKDGAEAETALADLNGRVNIAGGVARFSDLSFWIPGAHAHVEGTYNLINSRIDLRGRLRVDTKLSDTTSGAKSVLLRMMDPIFRKKRQGEVVPVKIEGTYEHPTFGLDLEDKRAEKGRPQ
jgi:hypothetical protein